MTHADHRHRLAVIAETVVAGARVMIGEACYAMMPDGLSCEIALSVAAAWQRQTLGTRLLGILARRARDAGIRYLVGDVLRSNEAMTALARKVGSVITMPIEDARLIWMTTDLSRLDTEPLNSSFFEGGSNSGTCRLALASPR